MSTTPWMGHMCLDSLGAAPLARVKVNIPVKVAVCESPRQQHTGNLIGNLARKRKSRAALRSILMMDRMSRGTRLRGRRLEPHVLIPCHGSLLTCTCRSAGRDNADLVRAITHQWVLLSIRKAHRCRHCCPTQVRQYVRQTDQATRLWFEFHRCIR